ncbi:MAG: DUF2452 domain-containing protein [Verrucomicrobiales bacterium]|nr:DUF2452 domain-containing protein [Verrucomicrobiota bacterium JB025]
MNEEHVSPETSLEVEARAEPGAEASRSFMPYPASTLSPPIVPQDLTSFKSRGLAEVERGLQQRLAEIREEYVRVVDHFNWNKLVYESEIRFEPVIGETYHLYESGDRRMLSMISPDQWTKTHLASVRLNVDRQWQVVKTGPGVDARDLFGGR